ncbi:hypothetical protein KM043_017632 [Ampulex compressa]|nr:hypothetical protein KM043_017632 [Ampulex compressa]
MDSLRQFAMFSFACIPNLRRTLAVCANSAVNLRKIRISSARYYTTGVTQIDNAESNALQEKPTSHKKLGRAMRMYLERASKYDEFMKREIAEYEIGKRHLANMMGRDLETFTQEDIDRSIEYLFPSGLYDKDARPMLRHPMQLYPSRKEAEFDESGRPYNMFFYTCKPNYYNLLYVSTSSSIKGSRSLCY